MLKLRIITALVLLPIVLGAVFFTERAVFSCIAGVFFVAAGWEWSSMMKGATLPVRVVWMAALIAAMFCAELYQPVWLLTWLPFWWLLALFMVVLYPRGTGMWHNLPVQAAMGLLLLVPSWLAVVQVQDQGALGLTGSWALMFILLWVWAADTGAYFAGRALGRHKLAPSVSPGKTIEGLVGGAALALSVAALVAWLGPISGDRLSLLLVALVTVLASVLGDLLESMIKRQAGVKDSGKILPGHGGMLDRIDSVTAALPVALAGFTLTGLPGGL